ncbi:predicted protein [Naegleria gruberi]|uniref:Predicted protein n=1 Tax=Naegleria gruberi TaxID=5762 RepID=D2VNJ1_NAEGR|nr:uncharacterized protein NAEGRDRAFT_70519 [Naegleria gruberi]EFC41667.1 predicted protein [Naegleria gruberi]|eukprot:XP_002674411.1 predicted protein [Naegleria gruberi strain NEG-M]
MDGFSQERKKRDEYHGKSFYIRPAMFLIRRGKVIHSWRLNYADHCPKVLEEIVLKLDLKSGGGDDLESLKMNEKNVVKIESKKVIGKEEEMLNEVSNENETRKEECQNVIMEMELKECESQIKEQIQMEETKLDESTLQTIEISTQIDMPIIDTSREIPIYKRKQASSSLEIITPTEKKENEKIQTIKAKKSLQPKYSCFGNRNVVGDSDLNMLVVLENPKLRKYFKLFAHMEFNIENILFWEEVNTHYKPIASFSKFDKTKSIATSIGNLFLFDSHSVMHVNTSDKLREQVREQIQFHFESKSITELLPSKYRVNRSLEDTAVDPLSNTPEESDNISQLSIADRFNETVTGIFDPIINEMLSSSIQDMFLRFRTSDLFSQMISSVK